MTSLYTERFLALPKEVQEKLFKEHPRQRVSQVKRIDSCHFPELVKEIKEFAEKWDTLPDQVYLDSFVDEDYGYYSAIMQLQVHGVETDDQYYERLVGTYESQLYQEKRERAEYERLKSKFGQ